MRPPSVEHLSSLLGSHLSRHFASLAAGDVNESGHKNDGEPAQDVDEAAFHVVAKLLFRGVRRPGPDFEKGPIRFGVIIIKSRIRILVDNDGLCLSTYNAVWFPPLVAPMRRQVSLENDRMRDGRSLHFAHLASFHDRRSRGGDGCEDDLGKRLVSD